MTCLIRKLRIRSLFGLAQVGGCELWVLELMNLDGGLAGLSG